MNLVSGTVNLVFGTVNRVADLERDPENSNDLE